MMVLIVEKIFDVHIEQQKFKTSVWAGCQSPLNHMKINYLVPITTENKIYCKQLFSHFPNILSL